MRVIGKTYYLFEYGPEEELPFDTNQLVRLEAFLEEVWENRSTSGILSQWSRLEEEPIRQPLLKIRYQRRNKGSLSCFVSATNYVGILRFEGYTLHLMPKLFKNWEPDEALKISNTHLLWWLSYNQWLDLPKQVTSLSFQKADFLEILIHLFTTYTYQQIQQGPYQTYQEIEDETTYLKGQLIFNDYINNYLARAKTQKMYCRYDSFELDNKLNRIIKCVCRRLLPQTAIPETSHRLNLILHHLHQVKDVSVSAHQCDEVLLNRMFGEYQLVLDYCKMFLQQSQTSSVSDKSEAFAFLVPMERVFEEFVLGFLKEELKPDLRITGQYQQKTLTTNGRFRLRPDLYVENVFTSKAFIADSKYKLLYNGIQGIVQADLYQMLAYAIRHGTYQIKIFYPNWENEPLTETHKLEIRDEFAPLGNTIKMEVYKLGITRDYDPEGQEQEPVNKLFEHTKQLLKESLLKIFST